LQYESKLIPARFLKRENRFLATVIVDGKKQAVHVPNSGRLGELLIPNREVFLLEGKASGPPRKTRYTMVLSRFGSGYVSVEAAGANHLFEEALGEGRLTELKKLKLVRREKRVGLSRLDFVLEDEEGRPVYVEVKSVSLVEDGRALFPDAPTARGSKHIEELIAQCRKGISTGVVFVIQRSDARSFSPNDRDDPRFGQVLRRAFKEGVKLMAYRCEVNTRECRITDPVPVVL
jgi:sugar fermentation stimulation protein A